LHNYQQDFGRLPPAVVRDADGRPLYSWRVLILPYLEREDLYKRFHLDEPWDSPHNRELLAERPGVYAPVGVATDRTMTYSQVLIGPGTAFEGSGGLTAEDFPDGPGRTLLVVEAAEPVHWSRPMDLAYLPEAQLPALGGVFKASRRPFDSGAIDGFNVLFADGRVLFLSKNRAKESTIRAIITRNGREPVDLFDL
jgi:prepilin-type processing-associated H-X9-DG protein